VAQPERTEKPTPKRRSKARREGRVARSADLSAAGALLGGLAALALQAPALLARTEAIVHDGLARSGRPGLVAEGAGLGALLAWSARSFAAAAAPVALGAAAGGLVAGVAQAGLRFSPKALRPSFERLNPGAGLKRLLGKRQLVELAKSLAKLAVVGGAGASALWAHASGLGALVGAPPGLLAGRIGSSVLSVAVRAGAALLALALLDYAWQRRLHERSLRMTKDEVKREARENDLSPELRGRIRRRQVEVSRRRMLAEVARADVVVVNPTHYAVALRYDGTRPAPEVVAKGADHLARRIREAAEEARVPVVHAPPLARALYRDVELGGLIPEELFHAVAEVLAFVFRTAGARRRVA